jgi:hypothetical protein
MGPPFWRSDGDRRERAYVAGFLEVLGEALRVLKGFAVALDTA